ncbi:helix-turn-helix domain-containing protein [uncultured Jatrophihabitans sp.]|uniref:helix-turn-helix domain-containing protein n=1 Tax=uncultured Jatrophihabitans sp. TaxID=1610747 RepID=UPI0035CAF070
MTVNSDAYLAAVASQLNDVDDAVARARVVNDEIAAVATVLEKLGELRADAVRAARETMSVQTIAAAMGVTRARVYQLIQ